MTTRLLALVHNKVALAVLGVLLAGGSGTAVVAANHGQIPFTQSAATASHTPNAASDNGDHAHTVSIEGTLTAYSSGNRTISVKTKDSGATKIIDVNSSTRVNGEHANSLSDLTNAINHEVQVQATKQSNGSLLAWKITVSADTSSHGSGNGSDNGKDNGSGSGSGNGDTGQQHVVTGTIASIGSNSFTVTVTGSSTTTVTVTVSSSTQFQGMAHDLSSLKKGMRVTVEGSMQSSNTFSATRITAEGE